MCSCTDWGSAIGAWRALPRRPAEKTLLCSVSGLQAFCFDYPVHDVTCRSTESPGDVAEHKWTGRVQNSCPSLVGHGSLQQPALFHPESACASRRSNHIRAQGYRSSLSAPSPSHRSALDQTRPLQPQSGSKGDGHAAAADAAAPGSSGGSGRGGGAGRCACGVHRGPHILHCRR